jgi:hypothetical protein
MPTTTPIWEAPFFTTATSVSPKNITIAHQAWAEGLGKLDDVLARDVGAALIGDAHALQRRQDVLLGPADLIPAGCDVTVDGVGKGLVADLGRLNPARLCQFLLALVQSALRHVAIIEGAGFPMDNLPSRAKTIWAE